MPPRGATLRGIKRIAAHLHDWIDAANITDGQGAVARMSSWAGSLALMQSDVEPVMQFSCRDRNRIALQADLLGAAALDIPNVLCITGDHPKFGDHPEAKPVFDFDSIQLLWTARTMREEKHLLSGQKLSVGPSWFIGAVENPSAAPQRFRAERLGKKVAAGAQFIQTQFVFDVPIVARWMQQVHDLGLCRSRVRALRRRSHTQPARPGVPPVAAGRRHPGPRRTANAGRTGGPDGEGSHGPVRRDDPAATRDSRYPRRPYNRLRR